MLRKMKRKLKNSQLDWDKLQKEYEASKKKQQEFDRDDGSEL